MGNVGTLNVHVGPITEPEGEPSSGQTSVPAGAPVAPAASGQTGVFSCDRRRVQTTSTRSTQTDELARPSDILYNVPDEEHLPTALARAAATRTWTPSSSYSRRQIDFQPIAVTDLPLPLGRRPSNAEFSSGDLRAYAVWHIPGYANLIGIHWSRGRLC